MTNSKKIILLVEDNLAAAKVARFIFEMLGCQVEHVDDGDKAVNLVKEQHFDGICMDIGLPTMSGTMACIAIRKHELKNHQSPIPIIALTGNYNPEELKEYKAAGMQEVIAKPLTKDKAEYFLSLCHR